MHQKDRCKNVNCKSYKWYGAKGIRVEYDSRAFVSWWLHEYAKREWIKPSVGRIDHSKNYSFDNIEMVEFRDNVLEENARLGHTGRAKRRIVLLDSKGNPAIYFSSVRLAHSLLGLGNVSRVCRGEAAHDNGFQFRYAGAN